MYTLYDGRVNERPAYARTRRRSDEYSNIIISFGPSRIPVLTRPGALRRTRERSELTAGTREPRER